MDQAVSVIPILDWSSCLTRAESATKKAEHSLCARDYQRALDHLLEAKKHLEMAVFWISQRGKQ
jgi:hypothetical protein